MSELIKVNATAFSNADSLGYLGQQAVAQATGVETEYRIIGGHMVRLLLLVYHTPAAIIRSTIDADTAVNDLEVIGPIVENLKAQEFNRDRGNVFTKIVSGNQRIEINVLASRRGASRGIRPQTVLGVGQVDTLPELAFALSTPALKLDVTVKLSDGHVIHYRTRIPNLEAAVVLKTHSWKARGIQTERDLADLHSLFEIREAHPGTTWRLREQKLIGFRRDTASYLYELSEGLTRKRSFLPVPRYIDRLRMAALIKKHVTRPQIK